MIHDGKDIGRKDRLVVVVDVDGRVRPPQKGLREGRRVIDLDGDLQVGAVRIEAETGHALRAEHALDLAHPHGFAAVGGFLDAIIDGCEGGGAVVLRPVELDAARNPRPGQPDQRRLDDAVVVDEVIVVGLVERHLHAPAKLGQQHDQQVAVLQKDRRVLAVGFDGVDAFDHGVGIDGAAAALVDAFFEK